MRIIINSIRIILKGLLIFFLLPGCRIASWQLYEGDIIIRINNSRIENIIDFYRELNETGKEEITFRVHRAGTEILLGLVK